MITEMIRQYFSSLAHEIAPKLRQVRSGELEWESVFARVISGHAELTDLLRKNYEDLNISELIKPTDLDKSNLGILSRSLTETDSQGHQIDFPTAPTQQNSQSEPRRISG
jgi:hypothetical protein